MTYATFTDDDPCESAVIQSAVIRCREIISEASRRRPEALNARHPAIQWKDRAAAGHMYRHEYEDVAAREGRDTLTLHLPPVRLSLRQNSSRWVTRDVGLS